MKLNPDCENQIEATRCDGLTFVHVEATSADNTIHYLWDLTGSPSLFLAQTDKNTTLGIDWNRFMRGEANSVNFSSTPDFIFSAVINKIFLFNDAGDEADVNKASNDDVTAFDPHSFTWTRQNLTQLSDEVVMTMNSGISESNGSFAIKVIIETCGISS